MPLLRPADPDLANCSNDATATYGWTQAIIALIGALVLPGARGGVRCDPHRLAAQ
jgi:hypothetical protein